MSPFQAVTAINGTAAITTWGGISAPPQHDRQTNQKQFDGAAAAPSYGYF